MLIWIVIGAVVLLAGVVSARMVATRHARAARRRPLHTRYTARSGCHKSLDNIRQDCEASAQASKERRDG